MISKEVRMQDKGHGAEGIHAKDTVGTGIGFNRIRRITGYLVGDVQARFNDAKRAEEHERVKHGAL